MFAVIKTGGKQYRVVPDDLLQVARLAGEPGQIVQLSDVLVVGGDTPVLGNPAVAGASVAAEVLEHETRTQGHRVQEAPPQEFAAQARASPGIHADPHHRNSD